MFPAGCVRRRGSSCGRGRLRRGRREVLGAEVDRDQEAVGAPVFERLGADPIGFHFVRHHDETVVARRAPVPEVLQHHRPRAIGRAGAHELDLGRLAAVHGRVRAVLIVLPDVDRRLGRGARAPLHREEMADDVLQARALGRRQRLVEIKDVPVHLALGEIAAEVVRQPELGAVERGRAVVAPVDAVGEIGAAVVRLRLAMIVMAGGLGVEVALAEHRAAARFDGRGVHRPVGAGARPRRGRGQAEQHNRPGHQGECDGMRKVLHGEPPFRGSEPAGKESMPESIPRRRWNERWSGRVKYGTLPMMSSPRLEVHLLGELEVARGGRPLALPASRKTRALLAYLVTSRSPQPRARLCELLWEGPVDPRAALRWSLTKLRPAVDDAAGKRLRADRERVGFDVTAVDVDLFAVESALAGGVAAAPTEVLEAAAARFRGEFLEGLDLPDCYRFQEWLRARREAVHALRSGVLGALVERRDVTPSAALRHARAWVALDPLDEAAQAAVVRLLGAAGHPREALAQYESCRRMLAAE